MKSLASPKNTREIIQKHGFHFSKKLGQNFLIDRNILEKIVDGAQVTKEDGILEIGPGIGTMTQVLSQRAKKVVAVEIDSSLLFILQDTLQDFKNVEIIHGDILKLPLKEILQNKLKHEKIKVVANLPYYVTTSIVMKLLEEELPIDSITIMVQKEVAKRMNAAPGGKDYGALSVAVQFYSKPQLITDVPSTVFMPPPKVDSTVIRLDIRRHPKVKVDNRKLFFKVVRAAFGKRRKTLLNALSTGNLGVEKSDIGNILDKLGIDKKRRGETLSLQEFANIANGIGEQNS